MPGFTSYDSIINAITAGQVYEKVFGKSGLGTGANGYWTSYWKQGGNPGAGSDPAAAPGGTTYTGTVAGGIQFPDQATAQKHLLRLGAFVSGSTAAAASLMLYDRLRGISGLTTVTTGNTALTGTAIPRYSADPGGVCLALEVTTATTVSAATVAVTYTNQSDGSSVTPNFTVPVLAAGNMLWPMELAAGDTGVKAVTNWNVSAGSTAGVVNLVLIRPVAIIPIGNGVFSERDMVLQLAALPRIYDGACLGIAVLQPFAGAVNIAGNLGVAYN